MRMRNSLAALMMVLVVAAPSLAQLSKEFEDWGKGPAQHLMTKEEMKAWKSVRSDAEAQGFMDLFWAKRDPTPATPQNEFKRAIEELVKLADEKFREGSTRGAMTERGKTVILLGAPSRIFRRTESSGAPSSTGDPTAGATTPPQQAGAVTEVWLYEGDRVPDFLNMERVELLFRDDFGNGRFRSVRSQINLSDALLKAARQAITSPDLKEVPNYAQAPEPRQVVEVSIPAPTVTPPTSFKTSSLQAAFTDFKTVKTSPYKDVYVTYGEFVTSTGEYFVPVQLYLTKNPGTQIEQPVTFFGVVEDPAGKIVAVYEDPLPLQETRTEFFADKSLTLPPGKYTGTFGIATDGKPLAMARTEMDLTAIAKESPGISRLILSNNVFALPTAQQPTDPFAFGGIKVVPKGSRTFTRQDELWYFFELRNPGLDATSGQPKVQVKVDVEGTVQGKAVKMGAPLQEAAAEQLKGVPGHFGIGSSIPLAGFSPGDYTIKVKVIDTVNKQNYNLQEKFKVVG